MEKKNCLFLCFFVDNYFELRERHDYIRCLLATRPRAYTRNFSSCMERKEPCATMKHYSKSKQRVSKKIEKKIKYIHERSKVFPLTRATKVSPRCARTKETAGENKRNREKKSKKPQKKIIREKAERRRHNIYN